jgi:tetratricopeptide (TPR) repeat protein/S1-C subfamily serine protease
VVEPKAAEQKEAIPGGSHEASSAEAEADLAEKVKPSVVELRLTSPKFLIRGSAFVVDAQGTIVTNFHVIEDATAGVVVFSDKTEAPIAGYLAISPENDIAILRVQCSPEKLHALPLAAVPPRIMQPVMAFGSPRGLSGTVTDGKVSALRRGAELGEPTPDRQLIQTTAPISNGNSGGPLVDMKGAVVGVNTFSLADGENLNFAVSVVHVRSALSAVDGTVQSLPVPRAHQEKVNARPEIVDLTHDPSGAALLVGVRKVAVLVTESGTTATAKLEQLVSASAQAAFQGSDLQVVTEVSGSDALLFVDVNASGPSRGSNLDYVVEAFVCQRQTLSDGTVRLAITWSDFRQEAAPSVAAVDEVRHLAQSLFDGLLLARGGAGALPAEPTVRPPAYDAAADEAQARTLLNSAKSLAAARRPAAKWLWRVVDKHPFTPAAQEARQLLIDFYTGLIREDPGDGEAYRQRARVYVGEDDFDKAIADFTEAIGRDPKNPWAYCGRATVHFRKSEYDEAITDYTEAIRLDPKNAGTHFSRGGAYGTKGENDKAIADYTEAIRLNPKYAIAYHWRGVAFSEKGDYDAAIADCTEAIRLDPKDAHAYYFRGLTYESKSEHDKAIADYTQAIRLDAKLGWAYCFRGIAYEKKGDWDRAIPDFTEAIRLKADDAAPYCGRGWAYGAKGEYDAAIADCTEAIRLNPKFARAYYNRGWAFGKKGETTKAAADFAKAKELGFQPPK